MNAPNHADPKPASPETPWTAEQHLRAAMQELRNARAALGQRLRPANLIRRHPVATAGVAVVAGLILARMLKRRRRRRRARDEEESSGIASAFSHSLMMGLARNAGKLLPGLLAHWMAQRHESVPGKGPRPKVDESSGPR